MTAREKQHKINIIDSRCKGCGFCVEFCPKHVLIQSNQTNAKGYSVVRTTDADECSGCQLCTRICPEFAIFVETT